MRDEADQPTSVWLVGHNLNHYSPLALEHSTDAHVILQFDGKQHLRYFWKPLDVRLEDNNGLPLPDFPYLGAKVLVVSSRAIEVLQPLLQNRAEILELKFEGVTGKFYAVNVLTILDCLDQVKSQFERSQRGHIKRIKQYAFQAGCVQGQPIFKIPETNYATIYVNDAFTQQVENNELTGLVFYKI